MLQDRKNITIVFSAIALLLITLIAWLFILSPRFAVAADIGEQTAIETAKNETLSAELAKLQQQEREAATAIAKAETLAKKVPATLDLVGIYAMVTDAATKAGLGANAVTEITPGVPAPLGQLTNGTAQLPGYGTGSSMASVPLTISAGGNPAALAQFIANMEKMPRAMLTKTSTIGRDTKGAATLNVEATMFLLKSELPTVIEQVRARQTPPATTAAATG